MKNLLFSFAAACVCAPLCAAPVTNVTVTHPTTAAPVVRPVTSVTVTRPVTNAPVTHPVTVAPVSRPVTNVAVTRPVTAVSVTHPVTSVSASRPGASGFTASSPSAGSSASSAKSGASSSSSSYTPTYKQAKDLKAPDIPKAASLGAGSGLGMVDGNAAQKDRDAESFEVKKGESTQISIDDVLKKTQMPSDLDSKLKQRNFEAAKMKGKK